MLLGAILRSIVTGCGFIGIVTYGAGWAYGNETYQISDSVHVQIAEDSILAIDHGKFARFLANNRKNLPKYGIFGLNYAKISSADKQLLKLYLMDMGEVNLSLYNYDAQYAYWLNIYNAITIVIVLEYYPIPSFRAIEGAMKAKKSPWSLERFTQNGVQMSLDQVEHDILRGFFLDWRLHFAIHAATISSGSLQATPYKAEQLDAQLEATVRQALLDPHVVSLDGNVLRLDARFHWYRQDFGKSFQDILQILRKYREDIANRLPQDFKIEYFFDWTLNDERQTY